MSTKTTRFFASRWGIIGVGAVIGLLVPLLQKLGNPPNMDICVACFERDIAGALGLHRANVVQYIRPEIIGFGACGPSGTRDNQGVPGGEAPVSSQPDRRRQKAGKPTNTQTKKAQTPHQMAEMPSSRSRF